MRCAKVFIDLWSLSLHHPPRPLRVDALVLAIVADQPIGSRYRVAVEKVVRGFSGLGLQETT
jgi:hypothetical protein